MPTLLFGPIIGHLHLERIDLPISPLISPLADSLIGPLANSLIGLLATHSSAYSSTPASGPMSESASELWADIAASR